MIIMNSVVELKIYISVIVQDSIEPIATITMLYFLPFLLVSFSIRELMSCSSIVRPQMIFYRCSSVGVVPTVSVHYKSSVNRRTENKTVATTRRQYYVQSMY